MSSRRRHACVYYDSFFPHPVRGPSFRVQKKGREREREREREEGEGERGREREGVKLVRIMMVRVTKMKPCATCRLAATRRNYTGLERFDSQ